jgi:integrin beta 1
VKNKDNCDYIYIVGSKIVSTGNVRVKVERQHRPETCPIEIAVLPLVASVVGIVVLIGIVLLLIWKIVTHIHDKKEFLKFENETKGATWNLVRG